MSNELGETSLLIEQELIYIAPLKADLRRSSLGPFKKSTSFLRLKKDVISIINYIFYPGKINSSNAVITRIIKKTT